MRLAQKGGGDSHKEGEMGSLVRRTDDEMNYFSL